jgi:hypothetical protein
MRKRNKNQTPDPKVLTSDKMRDTSERALTPVVSRLLGLVSNTDAVKRYHEYLVEKYDR